MSKNIFTGNDYGVGVAGSDVVILTWSKRIPRESALRLAAWIVAVTPPMKDGDVKFEDVLAAVQGT